MAAVRASGNNVSNFVRLLDKDALLFSLSYAMPQDKIEENRLADFLKHAGLENKGEERKILQQFDTTDRHTLLFRADRELLTPLRGCGMIDAATERAIRSSFAAHERAAREAKRGK